MNPSALPPLLILLALVMGAVAWQAARRPVQRRLAFRDIVRRRNETILVVAGSLLGTALITGSFIVGDTLDTSIKASATTQLGPVDETIVLEDAAEAQEIVGDIRALDDERIDGASSLVAVPAAFSTTGSENRRAEPQGQMLEIDFVEGREFGGDATATGLEGDTPAGDEAAVGEDLAEVLGVTRGDRITGYLYGAEVDLEVARILPQVGLAGYFRGFSTKSMNVFVEPGTIAGLSGGEIPEGATAPQTTVIVSNRGGIEDGAELSGEVEALIEEEVLASRGELRIDKVKEDTLEVAEESGDEFSSLFLNIGAFAIIAGILLLVNIFVMLAEERKNQLGMLRAIGMRRSDLVRVFTIEGAMYTLMAGVLGAALGILVGWAIVVIAAPIFSGAGDFSLQLLFSMTPASIVGGFCIGFLISMVTVFLTSLRISRINIIRAIRDLPEPKVAKTRKRTLALGVLASLLGAAWFIPSIGDEEAWAGAILGPVIMAWGLVPLIGRFMSRRWPMLAAALFSLFWGIFGNAILGGQFFESGELFAFVIQGVVLTFSAVLVLTQLEDVLEGFLRRVAARRLPLRLGLAYPLSRRFRTGLTLGMFALVMFTMVFIASMSSIFSSQVDRTAERGAGGFDIYATANEANPPEVEDLEGVDGVQHAVPATYATVLYKTRDLTEPELWSVTGVDEDFVTAGTPALTEKVEGLTGPEVWDRLLVDPNTVIVDDFFLQGGGGPPAGAAGVGAEVEITDPITGATRDLEVIGVVEVDVAFAGSYLSRESLGSFMGEGVAQSRYYLQIEDGARGADVAARLQGEFLESGVEADTFRALVDEQNAISVQFLRLMQGYLALGLLVGIAGLGVVMVRAVRERRREVGVLRSLGFLPRMVRSAFLVESAFVAFAGIAIGAVLALVTASQLVENGDFGGGLEFVIPWANIGVLCGISAVAALLATAWPAQQASEIPPAVALRIAD
jgi:putative ABC transport system permease protein